MSSAISHQLVLVLVAVVVRTGYSQDDCAPPTASDLEAVIAKIIQGGESAPLPDITLSNFNIVCRAFAQQQGLLRIVSVVVEYTCTGSGNCPSGTAVEQIESGCQSGSWSNTVFGTSEPSEIRTQSPVATLSTTARDDCSFCLSPLLAGGQMVTTDTVTHCVDCDPACDEGLMRCYGNLNTQCCNFYNNSVCVDECPGPFPPNADHICVCPVGKTGHNCEEDIMCEELETANGMVGYTNTTMISSVAIYSCNDGYNLVGDTIRTCLANGSWSSDDPMCEKACEVAECQSCESDITKCDACTSGKVFDEKSGICASVECEECEDCEDCDGLQAAIIVLAVLLAIALLALALETSLVVYLKKTRVAPMKKGDEKASSEK